LPADTNTGDYIEIGMLGAYGCAMRTGFNGFGAVETYEVGDEPMASLYVEQEEETRMPSNVVKL
jgi:ornithine decarboxylase